MVHHFHLKTPQLNKKSPQKNSLTTCIFKKSETVLEVDFVGDWLLGGHGLTSTPQHPREGSTKGEQKTGRKKPRSQSQGCSGELTI